MGIMLKMQIRFRRSEAGPESLYSQMLSGDIDGPISWAAQIF